MLYWQYENLDNIRSIKSTKVKNIASFNTYLIIVSICFYCILVLCCPTIQHSGPKREKNLHLQLFWDLFYFVNLYALYSIFHSEGNTLEV